MQSEVHHTPIIIEDPFLRDNNGFFNYRKLLNLMDKYNFFTTITFIPFNFNRTHKRIATLFRERPNWIGL